MTKEHLNELKENLLTRKELCELLKVSSVTVWSWAQNGIIKEYKLGRNRYYLLDEILEALKGLKGGKKNEIRRI